MMVMTVMMTMIIMVMIATPPAIMLVDQPLVDPIGPVVFMFPMDSGSGVMWTKVGKFILKFQLQC